MSVKYCPLLSDDVSFLRVIGCIDKILERGDALEQVARKAKEIEEAGQDFKKVTVPFKKKAWRKNLKYTICLCFLCTSLSPHFSLFCVT